MRKAKQEWAKRLISKAEEPAGFWKAYRKLLGSESSMPTLTPVDKPPAVTAAAKAELLSDCLSRNYVLPGPSATSKLPADLSLPQNFVCPVSFRLQSLQHLSSTSAIGLDQIQGPFLKGMAHVIAKPQDLFD